MNCRSRLKNLTPLHTWRVALQKFLKRHASKFKSEQKKGKTRYQIFIKKTSAPLFLTMNPTLFKRNPWILDRFVVFRSLLATSNFPVCLHSQWLAARIRSPRGKCLCILPPVLAASKSGKKKNMSLTMLLDLKVVLLVLHFFNPQKSTTQRSHRLFLSLLFFNQAEVLGHKFTAVHLLFWKKEGSRQWPWTKIWWNAGKSWSLFEEKW